jgi:hypothetical protein
MYLFSEANQVALKVAKVSNTTAVTAKELINTALNNINLKDGIEIEKQIYKTALEFDDFKKNLIELAKK